MKGLMYKDLVTVLTSYRKNALLVLTVYTVVSIVSEMPFLIYAMVFLTGMYMLSTLSFDEYSHWDCYARTLPVTSGQIVGAKYLLSLAFMGGGTLVAFALTLVSGWIRPASVSGPIESLAGCLACLAVVLVYYAFSFPLSYKYGATKARSGVLMGMAVLFCLVAVAGRSLPSIRQMLDRLDALSDVQGLALIGGLVAMGIAAYLISWAVSAAVYKNKEF